MLLHPHRRLALAAVAVVTAGTVALNAGAPAQADLAPQPDDVVSTGSDIVQNSFNFLADGYHQLPGYNTAGNRNRFISFDSSGDAQGRSAFTDPRLLKQVDVNGEKYVKRSDLRLLNPTISLRAGQDLVVRPSGGGAGGRDAIINDKQGWIDIGRSPDRPNQTQQNTAQTNLGTKLITVQVATDRQLIATATTTNAPDLLSAETILKIYSGEIKTWSQVPGYAGPAPTETIVPLLLPTDAGMWNTFVTNVGRQNPGVTVTSSTLRANQNSIQVQQNDPTSITGLTEAERKNAIMPFPRGRFRTLNSGYYTQTKELDGTLDAPKTNLYNSDAGGRTPASAQGIKLLDGDSVNDVAAKDAPYGGNFSYNAIVRESDAKSTTPWQPGSTLNWVQALFYNPGGPLPFVRTPAGKALLEAAGVTPAYRVWGTDTNEIDVE